ncbi:MAG: hypothetical protein M3Z09_06580 [Acidobacteriota bacterium]|nr:hypothetical protein [Acidobacteriota bacterium]
MSKKPVAKHSDEMRQEYDLSKLSGGVRGKYHDQAAAGTNLVLIERDLVKVFPDGKAVNKALRVLAEAARETAAEFWRRQSHLIGRARTPAVARRVTPDRVIASW